MKTLLQLKNIHKAYGANVIFDDANVTVAEDQKIAVIGRNGAGKSTLCKMITGHEEADSGTILKASDFHLAYLEQHDPYALDETVIGFLQRYTGQEEWKCGKVAARFQIRSELLNVTIGELPGGYRTRVKLTSMLLADPNFLILDEPTNYLDLKTLILLEEFLQDYHGGFLIVSHDREFLKKTCNETLEIESGSCTLYPGKVDEYLLFKEDQRKHIESHNKNIEAKQKQLQEFVDRFRAKASKASQARSKMKEIARLQIIEVDHPLANVRIKIPRVDKRNGIALRVQDMAIGYPDKLVAQDITMEVMHGTHVAVLGDNGQGKTTFLRTMAGDLPEKSGTYRWSTNIHFGYYAQHILSMLDPESTVYSHLSKKADPIVTNQEILDIAGSFLFKGKDVEKKIAVLSGGEKARLCLAGLLLSKSQVLLLDEPTNHLDFETVEALGRALKLFHGTLFFVSHDRTFVNLVATEIVEVSDGTVKRYPGPYEEYVYHMEKKVKEELRDDSIPESKGPKIGGAEEYQLKKQLKSEKRSLVNRIQKIDERLEGHKREYQEIHDLFLSNPSAWSHDRNARYEKLARLIKEDEDIWIELTASLEKLKDSDTN